MTLFLLVLGQPVTAQQAARPLPSWQPSLTPSAALIPIRADTVRTRSHTKTGLLVGGVVGVAATTIFLIGFCSDPDTACGADEVGRAVLFIAVPATALGALIGSLVRTEE